MSHQTSTDPMTLQAYPYDPMDPTDSTDPKDPKDPMTILSVFRALNGKLLAGIVMAHGIVQE